MTFIWPSLLLSLLLLPLLVLLLRQLHGRRRRRLTRLGDFGLQSTSTTAAARRSRLPNLLYLLALALLLTALARPQMEIGLPRVEGSVILTFDVSNSMLADDLEPTRIAAAKEAARAFVLSQPSTVKVGIVAFSNGGLVVQPPTNVQADVLATIDRLTPQGATSLGHGIFTALNALSEKPLTIDPEQLEDVRQEGSAPLGVEQLTASAIVLLSDGENTGLPDPLDIAQIAAEAGVRVHAIGIGSPDGVVLEVDGFSVVTRLDEAQLQAIAELTDGNYYLAGDNQQLQQIYETIDLKLTVAGQKTEVTALFAAAALLLLLIGGILSLLRLGRIP